MVIHGTPQLVKAPSSYAVTLEELKAQLRITDTNEDVALQQYMEAASELTESLLGTSFAKQTRALYFDYEFPSTIYLRYPPVYESGSNLTKIEYIDATTGEYTELARSSYQRDLISRRPRIAPALNTSWPIPSYVLNAVKVTYYCGYGDETKVPAKLKQPVLLLAATWFKDRENISLPASAPLPNTYQYQITALKRWV